MMSVLCSFLVCSNWLPELNGSGPEVAAFERRLKLHPRIVYFRLPADPGYDRFSKFCKPPEAGLLLKIKGEGLLADFVTSTK